MLRLRIIQQRPVVPARDATPAARLKAIRARVDAFHGAADWAKRDARPSDEELEALQTRIRDEEAKLSHATDEQRALINDASTILRKARAIGEVALTLRRTNGTDALHPNRHDTRHAIEILGPATDD